MKVFPYLAVMLLLLGGVVTLAQEKEAEPKAEKKAEPKTCEELKKTFKTPSAFKISEDDTVKASVPKKEIMKGIRGPGDPRDKIPPIYDPKFESIEDASPFVNDDDRVLVFEHDGMARAYPHNTLGRHEICNDKIGDLSFMIIY